MGSSNAAGPNVGRSDARTVGPYNRGLVSVRDGCCIPVGRSDRPTVRRLSGKSRRHPQDRPPHRRPQRHRGRDPPTGRPRFGGFRHPPAEADDRHSPAARQPRRRAVLGRVRAGDDHGLWNAPRDLRARADRSRASPLQQERPQPGDGVHRRRRRAQLCRREDLVPDRHRRRPRDRELAWRAAHVLQARHALHDADPLAQSRLGDRLHRYRSARPVALRKASRARDESPRYAGGLVARERLHHVRRAACLARRPQLNLESGRSAHSPIIRATFPTRF